MRGSVFYVLQTNNRRDGSRLCFLFYPQIINFFLNPVQKSGSVRPVHLRVVELERNGKCRLQQAAFVFAPNKKRIIKNTAVHTDSTVYFILCQCGRSDNHAFRQVVIDATFYHSFSKLQIVLIK